MKLKEVIKTSMTNVTKFLIVEFFKSPADVTRYITIRKIPKRKIVSLVYNGELYLLFYYTTLRKEEKCNKRFIKR